ncbi:MAG: hypothetical protein NWF02_06615 [Candidatus Bathyarchaeota archaeon]|nr:hypothetical protein [Candidatus Bathyarchaeum sp.]
MKRLLKNKKALSPVVAAIILIAVTVAVSIAVAAWMGSLTIGFMETAEVTITNVEFISPVGTADDWIEVTLINTGTSDATVNGAKVNGDTYDIAPENSADGSTLEAGGNSITFIVDSDDVEEFNDGSKYSISIYGTDGSLLSSNTVTASVKQLTTTT